MEGERFMHKFVFRISRDLTYFGKEIGERITYNGKVLIITNIVSVSLDEEFVIVKGYGMEE